MIEFVKKLFGVSEKTTRKDNCEQKNEKPKRELDSSLDKILEILKKEFNESSDFVKRELKIDGQKAAIFNMDGLIDKQNLAISVLNPIRNQNLSTKSDPLEKYTFIKEEILTNADQIEATTYEDVMTYMTAGFAVLAIDGCNKVLAIGIQGFNFRGIAEPPNEVMQRESKEGFTEPLRINITMIRRRIRSPKLKFEMMTIGFETKTDIYLCYIKDLASKKIVQDLKNKLQKIDANGVLASGYISEFLEESRNTSLFSSIGVSERPDTVCSKILKGRVAVLIDGTPSVLTVPHIFTEYFVSMDDYTTKPYFATLTRILKYFSFFIAMLLPGLYVSTGTFNPELLPNQLISKIATATATTPFSLMFETFLIHLIYEIMREAGLRLPKPLGHAVSIVGGLVIGQTAVSSGLIGGPTLMIVALTALASYVIPYLYEPIAILRLVFIFAGGIFGVWGIMLIFSAVLVDLCAKKSFGVPYTSPISPFSLFCMRDVFVRSGFRTLSQKVNPIQNMPGVKLKNEDGEEQ